MVFPFIRRRAGIFIHPYWFIHPRLLASPFTCSGSYWLIHPSVMATHPPVMATHPFVGVLASRTGLFIPPFWLIQFSIPARPSTLTGLMYPPALAHSPVFVYIHPLVRGCPRTHTGLFIHLYWLTDPPILVCPSSKPYFSPRRTDVWCECFDVH